MNTGEKKGVKVSQRDISRPPLRKKRGEALSSRRRALRLCGARNSKGLSLFENQEECDVSLRKGFFLLPSIPSCASPLPTDSQGWECVLVETEDIFCLPGYTRCVLSPPAPDGADTLRFSLAVSRWRRRRRRAHVSFPSLRTAPTLCTACTSRRAYMCPPACVCVNGRFYVSVCVIFGGLLQRRINQRCLGSGRGPASHGTDELRGSLIKRPVTDVMASTQTASRL